jgi:hypothetical protein
MHRNNTRCHVDAYTHICIQTYNSHTRDESYPCWTQEDNSLEVEHLPAALGVDALEQKHLFFQHLRPADDHAHHRRRLSECVRECMCGGLCTVCVRGCAGHVSSTRHRACLIATDVPRLQERTLQCNGLHTSLSSRRAFMPLTPSVMRATYCCTASTTSIFPRLSAFQRHCLHRPQVREGRPLAQRKPFRSVSAPRSQRDLRELHSYKAAQPTREDMGGGAKRRRKNTAWWKGSGLCKRARGPRKEVYFTHPCLCRRMPFATLVVRHGHGLTCTTCAGTGRGCGGGARG